MTPQLRLFIRWALPMLVLGFVIGAVLVCGLLIAPANAASFTYQKIEGKGAVVYLDGSIVDGDTERLKQTIAWAESNLGVKVFGLGLNSTGGIMSEAMDMAEVVRGKLMTRVASVQTCASACVTILLAGKERYVHLQAKIGVHRLGTASHGESNDSEAATTELAGMYAKDGMPADIIGHMVLTPASDIYWLTPDDKRHAFKTWDDPPTPMANAPLPAPKPTTTTPVAAPPIYGNCTIMVGASVQPCVPLPR